MKKLLRLPVFWFALVGCTESSFQGDGKPKPAKVDPPKPTKNFTVSCAEAHTGIDVTGSSKRKIILEGDFCPQIQGQLNLIFVVDVSGSMGDVTSTVGNDAGPQCKRYQAAETAISKLRDLTGGTDSNALQVGLVQFHTTASLTAPLSSLKNFSERHLNDSTFCVKKENTNYQAAFESAYNALSGLQGSNVVVFVTDGAPTVSNSTTTTSSILGPLPNPLTGGGSTPVTSSLGGIPEETKQAGIDAAKRLRQLPNTSLYAIYIENDQDIPNFDPRGYLTEVTNDNGDDRNVALVSNNEEMIQKMKSLLNPDVEIHSDEVSATLMTASGEQLDVPITMTPKGRGVWSYETEPFFVRGTETAEHTFQIVARTTDGELKRSNITIHFNPD